MEVCNGHLSPVCLIFKVLDSKLEDKNSALNDIKHSPTLKCSKCLHEWNFDLLGMFPKIELLNSFKGFITYIYIAIFSCILFTRHDGIALFI
jgi:hypothetical protein